MHFTNHKSIFNTSIGIGLSLFIFLGSGYSWKLLIPATDTKDKENLSKLCLAVVSARMLQSHMSMNRHLDQKENIHYKNKIFPTQ